MPVKFELNPRGKYFISRWLGRVSDVEILEAYKGFFEGEVWSPNVNVLTDLSQADFAKVSTDGLMKLAEFSKHNYQKHGISVVKTAVFSPGDLEFGMARVYGAFTHDVPETVEVFRTYQDAVQWLNE